MTREIPLTRGLVTIVDDEDFAELNRWSWSASYQGYAIRSSARVGEKQKALRMHRVLLCAPPELYVDHINGRPWDNRRANLRICTHAENLHNAKRPRHNRSGFKGASWDSSRGSWRAYICLQGRTRTLGRFADAASAAQAYDRAAREFFGEFARPNSPVQQDAT